MVVTTPTTEVCEDIGPGCGTRPKLGLCPTSPQNAAGMRIEPPPSLAVPRGTTPAATAAAEPLDDPPGVRSRCHGLRLTPHALVRAKLRMPNSGAAVLPTGTQPAARSRATSTSSAAAGSPPLNQSEPCEVGMPAQSWRSFTPSGTPASGPGSSPRATAASTASAERRANPSSTCTKALSSSLVASMRTNASSSSSTAVRSPLRTEAARLASGAQGSNPTVLLTPLP